MEATPTNQPGQRHNSSNWKSLQTTPTHNSYSTRMSEASYVELTVPQELSDARYLWIVPVMTQNRVSDARYLCNDAK